MSDTETSSDDYTELVTVGKGGRLADSGWSDECPETVFDSIGITGDPR